jgi:hypothetical protein
MLAIQPSDVPVFERIRIFFYVLELTENHTVTVWRPSERIHAKRGFFRQVVTVLPRAFGHEFKHFHVFFFQPPGMNYQNTTGTTKI